MARVPTYSRMIQGLPKDEEKSVGNSFHRIFGNKGPDTVPLSLTSVAAAFSKSRRLKCYRHPYCG